MRSDRDAERFKSDLTLHYINAKLQRAAKIPPLARLTGDRPRAASYQSLKALFQSKPVFKPQD